MSKFIRLSLYIIVITLTLVGVFFFWPAGVRYQVTERYTFSAGDGADTAGDGADTAVYMAIMSPKDNAYQTIENTTIDWPGDSVVEDHEAVDVIWLTGQLGANSSLEAELSYAATLRQGRMRWDAPVFPEDTQPQKDIESHTPAIAGQAGALCASRPENAAYATYHFTADHLSWPTETRTGDDQSALAAYHSQIGVCGDFTNLMTALNRACDNPARAISGLSMPLFLPPLMSTSSTWMHPGGAHAWVEVQHDGQWTIADPSWASNMPLDRLWFGRSQGQYLSYGELGAHDLLYAELMGRAEDHGEIVGGMSAPLKFVAWGDEGQNITITPTVEVKKVSDIRWVLVVSLYIVLILGLSLFERRLKQRAASEPG